MKKRREAIDIAKEIYLYLKQNQTEHSINHLSKLMKAKYEITIKSLEFLKDVELLKERKGNHKPIAERLFSLK